MKIRRMISVSYTYYQTVLNVLLICRPLTRIADVFLSFWTKIKLLGSINKVGEICWISLQSRQTG